MKGAVGKEQARQAVEQSDCLLMLGAFMTDVNLGIFTAKLDQALTISSSSEGSSIAFHRYPDVLLDDFLSGLLDQDLPQRALDVRQPVSAPLPFKAQDKPITIARLFEYLESFVDDHIVLLADPGEAMFAAADLTIRHPAAFPLSCVLHLHGVLRSLAPSVPRLARPDLRPLVLVGDGAFQMTGMEISTAARFGLSPIVVVLNKRRLRHRTAHDRWRVQRYPRLALQPPAGGDRRRPGVRGIYRTRFRPRPSISPGIASMRRPSLTCISIPTITRRP